MISEEMIHITIQDEFPDHKIESKIGAPVMILRNIDALNGLCNGTQGIVTALMPHLIEIEVRDPTNQEDSFSYKLAPTPRVRP